MNRYRELMQRTKAPEALQARVLARAQQARRTAPARRARFAAASALAALLLTATAGAAVIGLAGGWREFFGAQTAIPENAVQTLDVSQSRDGYTITVEQAMTSDSRVIVLYSVKKDDGGKLPSDFTTGRGKRLTLADDPDYAGANGGKSGAGIPAYRSDDGRTLHWYDEWHDDAESLLGRKLALELPAIGRSYDATATLRGDLQAVYDSAPASFSRAALRDGGATVAAALAAQTVPEGLLSAPAGSGIRFRGAALIDGAPAVALSYPAEENADTAVYALYLDRDGSEVYHTGGGAAGETLCFFPLGGGDFDTGALRFSCSLFETCARGFRLEFTSQNAAVRAVPLGFTAQAGGVEAEFLRAELSPLDLKLVFRAPEDARGSVAYAQPVTLVFADGSTLDETARSGFSEGTTHTVTYLPAGEARYFPDVSRVTALRIAGKEIALR